MIGSPNALLWKGLLAIGIGLVTVFWPGVTLGAVVIVFAVYAFIAAGTDAVRAFSSAKAGPVFGWLLLSLLSVAAGIVALAWPGITVYALTIWIGAWALAAVFGLFGLFGMFYGISAIVTSFQVRHAEETLGDIAGFPSHMGTNMQWYQATDPVVASLL